MTENNKSATQRIEDLEASTLSVLAAYDNMAKDLLNIKEALKLLGNKVSAVVQAVNQGGPITDTVLDKFMIENSINELKNKIDSLVKLGLMVSSDAIKDNSFVVVKELDANGNVTNPRHQFRFADLNPEFRSKMLGAKVGTSFPVADTGSTIEVIETYDIVEPKNPDAPAAEAAPAPADTAPAPAPADNTAPAPTPDTDSSAAPVPAADPAPAAATTVTTPAPADATNNPNTADSTSQAPATSE